jgi:hypothetical protein
MRFHPVALAVLVACSAALPARADDAPPTLVDRSEKVADARGLAGVDVDNARGRVQVRPSADGRIHVVATRVFRMGDMASARRYAAQTSVQAGPRAGRFAVDVHYPRRIETGVSFFDFFSINGRRKFQLPSIEVQLDVQVPAGFAVHVSTTSGDVDAGSLSGPVTVSTTSGDVRLAGSRGASSVQTVSGDIALDGVAGARVRATSGDVVANGVGVLDCSTVSGDIEVHGARDSLRLDSQSGDLSVDDAPAGIRARTTSGELAVHAACGGVSLSTTSGDLRGRLKAPLRSAELSSVSGDLTAELAPGLSARLLASTASGAIDCALPMTVLRHDRTHLEARTGPGGPVIGLNTVSGNLTVTSGGK